VGEAYNETLTATSDTSVTWSIDGDLPDGLGLDTETGDITGTPEEEGAFEFTVKAINAAGNDTKDLTITIVIPLIETVPIQGGTFTMGSPEDETFRTETQHDVTLTGFRMGKYQVTQAQYVAVIGSNPSAHTAGGLRSIYVMGLTTTGFPVETVNWYDVIVFCNRLSMREGLIPAYEMQTAANSAVWSADPSTWGTVPFGNDTRWNAVRIATGSTGYRLPTEAQWEYACRAGTWGDNYSAYNTGDTLSDSTGWYTLNSGSRTHSVGEKPANAWGLYDMHGNVFEWCWDWFIAYEADSQTDPTGPLSGSFRMYRGGPWSGDTEILRSAFRGSNTPQSRLDTLGFRVALPAE
jgi:formylglycine-generating enzyme required for sulfatase activity